MKNRYFTCTLILLFLLTCGILIKADSQGQLAPPKFKIAVSVSCKNEAHQAQVEGAIKRELRSFGDVQIVGSDFRHALWEFRIDIHLMGIKNSYGNINKYAISESYYVKVPIEHITPDWQGYYREYPAICLLSTFTGYVGVQKLDQISKTTPASFDKTYLQPARDSRERRSR